MSPSMLALLTLADYRSPGILPYGLGLDQEMVRSNYHLKDLHPVAS